MTKVYVISGLGADRSVFTYLDWGSYEIIYLDWIEPKKKELLKEYATRLVEGHDLTGAIVLGLSLGGMMAWEIGAACPVKGVISLSSITNKKQLPFFFKLGGWLRVFQWFPIHWFAKGNRLTHFFFGVKSDRNKAILDKVLREQNRDFLYWSLAAVTRWESSEMSKPIFRIHGAKDFVLPRKRSENYDVLLENEGHLMVLESAEKVGMELRMAFQKLGEKE